MEVKKVLKPKPPRLILPPNKRISSCKDYNRQRDKKIHNE